MLSFLMETSTRSIQCQCCPIFFCLCVLLFYFPILHCHASNCLEAIFKTSSVITDGTSNSTLISPGNVFELGFFSPSESNDDRRYLGIWYYNQSNPKIIVWVANRDKPLLGSNSSLVVKNGTAKLLDGKGVTYWSINAAANRNATSLCLEDSGNLKLSNRGGKENLNAWQSFDHPTDTFLPGMDAGKLNLISWKTQSDPAQGNYKLLWKGEDLVIFKNGSQFWESTISDQAFQTFTDLLGGRKLDPESYNNTKWVIKFTGQIQFWKWETGGWFMDWEEPKDICSFNSKCGKFGSCNSNNGFLCKCLPGFTANNQYKWNSGNFTEGCSSISEACKRISYDSDEFLRMPMMKLSNPKRNQTGIADCKTACLNDCQCLAYSCGVADCSGASTESCLMWLNELTNLQEEYSDGVTIFVRSTQTDIESTPRDCKPCGTYTIPYPLSTSADCGDLSYFNFHCNATTGQLQFSTSNATFKVTSINAEAKKFLIQVNDQNGCDNKSVASVVLSPKDSLPYIARNCNVVEQSFLEVQQSFIEVEMEWKPPREPTCNATSNSECHNWPHTTCKPAGDGGMRCMCGSNYHWDGLLLKCIENMPLAKSTKKAAFPIKIVLPCIAGVFAIVLLCSIFFLRRFRRRNDYEAGSLEIKGDHSEGIDVPLFDWGSILAATNNFSDSNKLGKGGFGTVYEGLLPDGKKIAVKRLAQGSVQGIEEFRTEVVLIAKLQHRNLVRLVGYCVKEDEKILVYEYMPNGSLDSYLFDKASSLSLDWSKRFDIILGIARGLLYLHHDSRLRIIHRDLKPSNILLDEELNPKIADFGIARIVGGKDTQGCTSRVVGTYGYMSPEYAYEGLFSVKSDVFSFGVVLLETISGRGNSRNFKFENGASLLGHAWKLWNEGRQMELMDQTLNDSCHPSDVKKCIHVGLLCVQEEPDDRPTMSAVFLMLSGENVSLPKPKQPAFVSWKPLSETASSSSVLFSTSHDHTMTMSAEGR